VVVAGALLATRDSGGGLSGIQPNHVGIVDPRTNRIVGEVQVGIRPGPVAAGAGVVWVGNLDDRTLTKIDPRERENVGTVSLDERTPTALAFGARAVWVAHGLLGSLSRVDPQFGSVTSTIEVAPGASAYQGSGVALAGGSVWVVFESSTLARIDAASGRVAGKGFAGSQPSAVAVDDGVVWVANAGEATVQRFNPATFEEGPIRTISVGRRPSAVAFGEGALWVANASDDTVTRVDPSSGATSTIRVGDGPIAVVAGSGAVWVANKRGGTISRIDPSTNEVVRTVAVANAPSGLALSDGYLWVATEAP
jgi:YVTN family beta-propeller protein